MPTARKVFCDFEMQAGGRDFFLWNFEQPKGNNIQSRNKIGSDTDVKLACGRIGM